MKKIILATALSSILGISYSASADENSFYIRAEGGLGFYKNSELVKAYNGGYAKGAEGFKDQKAKNKTFGSIGFGVGYNVAENLRAEAVFSYPFLSEQKVGQNGLKKIKTTKADGTTVVEIDGDINTKFKPSAMAFLAKGYFDVYSVDALKFFVGGGLGVSRLGGDVEFSHIQPSDTPKLETVKLKLKNSMSLAFAAGAGLSYDISDGVALDVGYEYAGFGSFKDTKVKVKLADGKTEREFDTKDLKFVKDSKTGSHNVKFGVRIKM